MMNGSSFESSKQYLFAFNLKNSIVVVLRYTIIAQSYSIYVVLKYCCKVSIKHNCICSLGKNLYYPGIVFANFLEVTLLHPESQMFEYLLQSSILRLDDKNLKAGTVGQMLLNSENLVFFFLALSEKRQAQKDSSSVYISRSKLS